jgi:transketolase
MADIDGISFLRTTRADTPVLYGPDEEFPVGGSKTVRSSDDDDVTIVAAGITLHEALAAAEELAEEGVSARVIDLYSVKPIDEKTLRSIRTPIVTAEDHWAQGGLGEAVLATLSEVEHRPQVRILAVREMPRSGKPAELLAAAGIDAKAIAEAARALVSSRVPA